MTIAENVWIQKFRELFLVDKLAMVERSKAWSGALRVVRPVGPGSQEVIMFAFFQAGEEV